MPQRQSENAYVNAKQLAELLRSRVEAETAGLGLTNDKAFERFAMMQILKEYEVDLPDIDNGDVDGSQDGGVDGFFVFANRNLVRDMDEALKWPFDSRAEVDVYLIQAKNRENGGFRESELEKFQAFTHPLLAFLTGDATDDRPDHLNEPVWDHILRFRALSQRAAGFARKINIHYCVAVRSADPPGHGAPIMSRAADLERATLSLGADSASVDLIDRRRLLDLSRMRPPSKLPLRFAESLTSDDGTVALVTLDSFNTFISKNEAEPDSPHPEPRLRNYLFDSNVRAFQGDTPVNKAIAETLARSPGDDQPRFWWLNNGVTILCTQATTTGKTLDIIDAQIVNGLQTSLSIHRAFQECSCEQKRATLGQEQVIVKVIPAARSSADRAEAGEACDQVIRATNAQTSVPVAALRAKEPLQRAIETEMEIEGLYYERRKNYYRHMGRPPDRIVEVTYLAQALAAMGIGEPHRARSRPSTLFKDQTIYARLFSKELVAHGYVAVATAQREVDRRLRGMQVAERIERQGLRLFVSYAAVVRRLGTDAPHSVADVMGELQRRPLEEGEIIKAANVVIRLFRRRKSDVAVLKDSGFTKQVAKTILRNSASGSVRDLKLGLTS